MKREAMKAASKIEVGDVFGNGRGTYRKVIGIGDAWKTYPDQESEGVGYIAVRRHMVAMSGPDVFYKPCNRGDRCTRSSMRSWGKETVTPDKWLSEALAD